MRVAEGSDSHAAGVEVGSAGPGNLGTGCPSSSVRARVFAAQVAAAIEGYARIASAAAMRLIG